MDWPGSEMMASNVVATTDSDWGAVARGDERVGWIDVAGGLAAAGLGFSLIAGAVLGSVAPPALAGNMSGQPASELRQPGVHSASIFVMAVMAVAGARIVPINLLPVRSFEAILPLIVLVAVIFPLVAAEVLKRARLLSAQGFS